MADVFFSAKAFSKMLLHAAKYPHCSVNGVLLADSESERKTLTLVDAIPLFHLTLTLAPMMEIAFQQIDAYCKRKNLVLAGYYQANENYNDDKPNLLAYKVAERLQENFKRAILCMIDNSSLSLDCDEVCYTIYSQEHEGKWKKHSSCGVAEDGPAVASALLHSKVQQKLVDFDNHLDDITQSWSNPHVDQIIASTT